MGKVNYYSIHKNKKPKKLKYSSFYTKQEKENIQKCFEDFTKRIELIKGTARVVANCNKKTINALNNMDKKINLKPKEEKPILLKPFKTISGENIIFITQNDKGEKVYIGQ